MTGARRLAFAVLAGAALTAPHAHACGVCVEDKIAITYDHAVITKALERRHVVVFAEIRGSAAAEAMADHAKKAASRAKGVDRASVRSAAAPAALSFALDPAVQSPREALASIASAARMPGLQLELLKVFGR